MNDLHRHIVESAPEAILFADREGVIQLWNAGAELMFGYAADEAIGHSLDLIIPERLRERHWDGYHRVMTTGETAYGARLLAVPAQCKDGRRISLEFSIALIREGDAEIRGIATIMRDITERWERERRTQR